MVSNASRKTLFTLFLIFTTFIFSSVAYGVNSFTKNIKVTYRNINIYSYGQKIASSIEPFILTEQGITMVPLRTVSEALGQQITWDEKTSSIYIGPVTKKLPDTPIIEPTPMKNIPVLRNVGPFYEFKSRNIIIARRQFSDGIAVELENGNSVAEIVLELKGYYTSLEGYIGIDDETRNSSTGFVLTIYGDGIEKAFESLVKPSEYPRLVQVDVKGVKRLTIRVQGQDCEIGEYTRAIAALADFKFIK